MIKIATAVLIMTILFTGCMPRSTDVGFNLAEFKRSETATRLKINNKPNDKQIEAGVALYTNVLDKVRAKYPNLYVTSGFRNEALNKAVGGVPGSQHTLGEAIDFVIPNGDHDAIAQWMRTSLKYDQLILEPRWIHVSYKKVGNRQQYLDLKNK